jgi:hypothetical protein
VAVVLGPGVIRLLNPTAGPRRVRLSARVHAPGPRVLRLDLSGLLSETLTLAGHTELDREVVVPPGEGAVLLAARGPTVVPPNDGRALSFAVEGLRVLPAE